MKNKENDKSLLSLFKVVMIENVPSYANKIFYSLGFLSMICLFLLIITGIIMVFQGPNWWLTNSKGVFTRSVHLWAAQAFVLFMLLHVIIVFLTSGFRAPRKIVWVFGSLMFFLALMEAEFGYALRNDFSSQWRSLQGADIYNGSGLGKFINNLNYAQIYGIHIIIIPFIILGLLFLHYGLVRLRGIAAPYRKDYKYKMVKANHRILFLRGIILTCTIILLAFIFPSPIIAPVAIKQVASQDPSLMAKTLLAEFNHTSDTATYFDTIDPYKFDTRKIYIEEPYTKYITLQNGINQLDIFNSENTQIQKSNITKAQDYFNSHGQIDVFSNTENPVVPIISALVLMGQSGLYEAVIRNESNAIGNPTYTLRFLSDTGVLEEKANSLGIKTSQYGMLREEKGIFPPGAWWLAPLGLMDNTILKNDDNQDRDGAEILGILILIFIAFPYIPILNEIPDKLGLYKFIWQDKKIPR